MLTEPIPSDTGGKVSSYLGKNCPGFGIRLMAKPISPTCCILTYSGGRFDRAGFPEKVWQEILRLNELYRKPRPKSIR